MAEDVGVDTNNKTDHVWFFYIYLDLYGEVILYAAQ